MRLSFDIGQVDLNTSQCRQEINVRETAGGAGSTSPLQSPHLVWYMLAQPEDGTVRVEQGRLVLLLAQARSGGGIALAVTPSRIAATLLPGGRAAHSRFTIPFENLTNSVIHQHVQFPLNLRTRS